MESYIEELKRKIELIQRMFEKCQDDRQKLHYQISLQNARQVLANFLEV